MIRLSSLPSNLQISFAMASIDEVLIKIRNNEPVELCEIYEAHGLQTPEGKEKLKAALASWLARPTVESP